MKLVHAAVFLLLAVGNGPGLMAADRWYGSVEGWGLLIDPDGDCTFNISADQLEIEVPATPHGLSVELDRMNAPRVLQQVQGNCELRVAVSGEFQPQQPTVAMRTAYLGAGLVLMRDRENYIRLERAALRRDGRISHYVNFEQRRDGRLLRFGTPADFALAEDDQLQLKLVVAGKTVEGWVQRNDEDWHRLGEKQLVDTDSLTAGISATNATNVPQQAVFRSLRLTRHPATMPEAVDAPEIVDQRPQLAPRSFGARRVLPRPELPRASTPTLDVPPARDESGPPTSKVFGEDASEFEDVFERPE